MTGSANPRLSHTTRFLAVGARGGTRTRKPLRAMDFESIEFANFSTRAGAEKGSRSAVTMRWLKYS